MSDAQDPNFLIIKHGTELQLRWLYGPLCEQLLAKQVCGSLFQMQFRNSPDINAIQAHSVS
jgi:hypothetical protein